MLTIQLPFKQLTVDKQMSDSNSFSSTYGKRDMTKKRGSMDAAMRPDKKHKHEKLDIKRQIQGFSIDMNNHYKNPTIISINKNFTHRVDAQHNNLCDLRQEVEQLRMENQSLRQEVKCLKSNQSQLKYQLSKLQRQISSQHQEYKKLEKQFFQVQQKAKKYGQKIKQLFESLIFQKKKYSVVDTNVSKVKMVLSPSNSSISNTLDLKKFESQGYTDYFNNSARRYDKSDKQQIQEIGRFHNYQRSQKNAWSMQSSDQSPGQHIFKGQVGETFGTRH